MKIGKRIRLLREAKGASAKEMAEQIGISPTMVSLVESDERTPSVDLLSRIARVLGVPPAVLQHTSGPSSDGDGIGSRLERIVEDLAWIESKLSENVDSK